MIVIFKSTEENYRKEISGRKPNTIRKIDRTDSRFVKLQRKLFRWTNEPTHICIENSETGEHFVREIKDITEFEELYIISWEHE